MCTRRAKRKSELHQIYRWQKSGENQKVIRSNERNFSSDEEKTVQAVRVYGKLALTKYQLKFGGVAQLGEHLPCKQGVRSSILLISTRAWFFAKQKTCGNIRVKQTVNQTFAKQMFVVCGCAKHSNEVYRHGVPPRFSVKTNRKQRNTQYFKRRLYLEN